MTQINKQCALSPKQAARLKRPIDRRLDATLFKALSDPTRLNLLACLAKCGRDCRVSEIAECCTVDVSVVSRHLALMSRTGVLEARREGRETFYRVRFEFLVGALRSLADAIDACCQLADAEPSEGCQRC